MMSVAMHLSAQLRKALPVKASHNFMAASALFDNDHLVSCAGLVPVMTGDLDRAF